MEERSDQSPVILKDFKVLIGLLNQSIENNALIRLKMEDLESKIEDKNNEVLIDMKQAKKLSNRNGRTIRSLCPVVGVGVNGSHLFKESDVIKIKK